MGATNFDCVETGATLQEAYLRAVDQARYDHGHAGYTGTIAEKDGCVEWPLPEDQTVDDVIDAVFCHQQSHGEDTRLVEWYGEARAQRLVANHNDKWGPAVAFQVSPTMWHFTGWASC